MKPFAWSVSVIAMLLPVPAAVAQQPQPVAITPPQAEVVLHRVDERYNHLNSLRAHFTEHYSGMGLDRKETGTLLLQKPGRMAFHYDKPAGKVFVFDGHNALFYTPGDATATEVSGKQLDDLHTPLRFLLGHTHLAKELDGVRVVPVDGGYRISGVPHGMAARVHSITLQVTGDGTITALSLEEADGSATGFTLDSQTFNVTLPEGSFQLRAPDGVTVVHGSQPL